MFYFILGYFFLRVTFALTPPDPAAPPAPAPALILTPYIKLNQTKEARELSAVNSSLFLNVTSYSGFLTVDEEYGSNIFFWYFPVADKPAEETPWLVWLQGGPGASSLDGLFLEMGPFEYDGQLKLRASSWWLDYSMVFVDSPVGAGFSFTNSDRGFAADMPTYTAHLCSALQQLVRVFPALRGAPLFVAGESYAGRYVPALAHQLLQNNLRNGSDTLNLQGIILGNPVMRRDTMSDYTALFYQWGLVDAQGARAAGPLQARYRAALAARDARAAYRLHNELLDKLQSIAWQQQLFNVVVEGYAGLHRFEEFLRLAPVRAALHVGAIGFSFSNATARRHLMGDFLSEADSKVEALLEHHRVLIYCGQLDLTAPCTTSAEGRRKHWRWAGRDQFLGAPRRPWWDDSAVAGYVKSGGGLTEVLVKGAGHLVPVDRPRAARRLVRAFVGRRALPAPPGYRALPADTPQYAYGERGDRAAPAKPAGGLVASLVVNVLLVLLVAAGVVYSYLRRRRREAFFYTSVDNISDDIFLS